MKSNEKDDDDEVKLPVDLRDYFAAKAMQALLQVCSGDARAANNMAEASSTKGSSTGENVTLGIAESAYNLADSMLRARKGK